MNNMSKQAFTLAEVLITLAIIGVISAMTIPALINKTNSAENVVALKKAYETLSQAYYIISTENGGIQNILSSTTTDDDYANIFIPKLHVAKNCGTNNAKDTGCFTNKMYMSLDGITPWTRVANYSTVITNDGVSYAFDFFGGTGCSSDYSASGTDSSPLYNTCGDVIVDVNGPNKGPEKCGRDTFMFWVTKKGLYPMGSYPDNISGNCTAFGSTCAYKILSEGVMNY